MYWQGEHLKLKAEMLQVLLKGADWSWKPVSSICDLLFKSRNLSAELISWMAGAHPSAGDVSGQRIYLPSHILCQKAHQEEVRICQSHRPYVSHLNICLPDSACAHLCVCCLCGWECCGFHNNIKIWTFRTLVQYFNDFIDMTGNVKHACHLSLMFIDWLRSIHMNGSIIIKDYWQSAT